MADYPGLDAFLYCIAMRLCPDNVKDQFLFFRKLDVLRHGGYPSVLGFGGLPPRSFSTRDLIASAISSHSASVRGPG